MSERKPTVPKKMREQYDAVIAITDAVCTAGLNEEYAQLCRELAAKLARKRPSPLLSGRVENWAGGIAYAIARINFAFDKEATPHLAPAELCALAGVKQRTASDKAGQLVKMFRMVPFSPEWRLPSRKGTSVVEWLVSVNGLIVDVRELPREVQEEAFRLGLIPYVPE